VVGSQVAGGGGSCWLVRLGAAGVPLSTRDLVRTSVPPCTGLERSTWPYSAVRSADQADTQILSRSLGDRGIHIRTAERNILPCYWPPVDTP
jgi:hypothetical protein